MDMKKNRKAILFSLISVLFSILFVTIFSQSFAVSQADRIPASNIRIKVLDVYTRNFETYVAESIQIATYRTLDAITARQHTEGFFDNFSQFNSTFHDCMMCGYVDCSSKIPANDCNLGDYDLTARLDNISEISLSHTNILTNYTINSISIVQEDPFEVLVTVDINYSITDASSGFRYGIWTKNQNITESVSLIGLLDPLGSINDSSYSRRISRYIGPCEFNSSCWNFTTTTQFFAEKSYRYYANGTSFLQRYWNDYNDSYCCGIETIIHQSELGAPIKKNNSYIDQYYWSYENDCENLVIENITINGEEVHLDEDTASRYGINGPQYCSP